MKPAIFSICSANYFPKCLVLLDSLAEFAKDTDHYLFLADTRAACENIQNHKKWNFKIISMYDINLPHPEHFAFQYDVTELNTAIKPFVFSFLFAKGHHTAVYFDPDIEIFSSLTPMMDLLKENNALVTPHITEPIVGDTHYPNNWEIIWAGQFNFGYVALNATPDVLKFVKFWENTLSSYCIADLGRYFYDQLPGSLIPSLVEKAHVIRSHSYNMAYWNLFQRNLFMKDGQYYTDSGPLVFFHFSGLNEINPLFLTVHSRRVLLTENSPGLKLVESYIAKTRQHKKELSARVTAYPFNHYANGLPIPKTDRLKYLSFNLEQKLEFGNPFENKQKIEEIQMYPPKYYTYHELLQSASYTNKVTPTIKYLLMLKVYKVYSYFPVKSYARRGYRKLKRTIKALLFPERASYNTGA